MLLTLYGIGIDRIWEGRLAFPLKDYIDRSFFQVSGKLDEQLENVQ